VSAYPEQLLALRASSAPTVQAALRALMMEGSRSGSCDSTLRRGKVERMSDLKRGEG
jgi:hypothetical protein